MSDNHIIEKTRNQFAQLVTAKAKKVFDNFLDDIEDKVTDDGFYVSRMNKPFNPSSDETPLETSLRIMIKFSGTNLDCANIVHTFGKAVLNDIIKLFNQNCGHDVHYQLTVAYGITDGIPYKDNYTDMECGLIIFGNDNSSFNLHEMNDQPYLIRRYDPNCYRAIPSTVFGISTMPVKIWRQNKNDKVERVVTKLSEKGAKNMIGDICAMVFENNI